MAVILSAAASNDGYIESASSNYSSALAGSNLFVDDTAELAVLGQAFANNLHFVRQYFLQFSPSFVADHLPISSYIRFVSRSQFGTNRPRNIELKELDFGTTVNTSDFRTPAQLNSNLSTERISVFVDAHELTDNLHFYMGNEQIQNGWWDSETVPQRMVMYHDKNRTSTPVTANESNWVATAEVAGTSEDPLVILGQVEQSLLDLTMGAQVQLSDGTTAYISQDNPATSAGTMRVWHWDGSSHTQIASFSAATRRTGTQNAALTRDSSDNLYLAISNNAPADPNRVSIRGLTNTGPATWTFAANQTFTLPSYEGAVNNIMMAWHPQGNGGTIVLIAGSAAARNKGASSRYALINAQSILNGTGLQVRSSGDAEGVFIQRPATSGANGYPIEAGTLLDICPVLGTSTGFVTSTRRSSVMSQTGASSLCRYQVNSNGNGFTSTVGFDATSGFSQKNPDSKTRIIALNESDFVTCATSTSTNFGAVVKMRRQSGSGFSSLADVRLAAEGLEGMQPESIIANSNNWDLVYSAPDNRVWFYYFDVNDAQRLLRTDINLTTGLAGGNVVEVDAAVGVSGSVNATIRTHRGQSSGENVLIAVGNRDGSSHSVIYIEDQLNVAPNAPILTPKQNYDATQDGLFEWEFSDPNTNDTQTAFQLQIFDVSDESLDVDTGKISTSNEFFTVSGGSLINNDTYQWRVKTWDLLDQEGPYSTFSQFSTSDSGVVNITFPAFDNDPSIITAAFLLTWTVSNTTQAQYRVWVYRTLDEVLVSDTGWVSSTATSHQVSGLTSDVEYRVELQIRDALMIESNIDTVLVTPSYNRPEAPVVSLDAFPEGGYILVSVDNPEPQGDRPNPTANEVYRRRIEETESYLIATIPPNSTFRDYEAASRTDYEYWARAGVEEA